MHPAVPGFSSSGNLIADRRYDYALALKGAGEADAARDVMGQVIALAPEWAAGWLALGEIAQELGDVDGARAAFVEALRLSPDDALGAVPRLAALGAAPVPDALPEAYVRGLFDQYAASFDAALVERLGYVVPWTLRDLIARETNGAPIARMLDLGCGTGLMGEAMRRHVSWLAGVDLSPNMVGEAGAKQIYDDLEADDLAAFLSRQVQDGADLVTAADVFVYCGALAPVFARAARVLAQGGLFAFSCERFDGDGYTLGSRLRFAHGEAYVTRELEAAGLALRRMERGICRQEAGEPVEGVFIIAAKPEEAGLAMPPACPGRPRDGSENPRRGA